MCRPLRGRRLQLSFGVLPSSPQVDSAFLVAGCDGHAVGTDRDCGHVGRQGSGPPVVPYRLQLGKRETWAAAIRPVLLALIDEMLPDPLLGNDPKCSDSMSPTNTILSLPPATTISFPFASLKSRLLILPISLDLP